MPPSTFRRQETRTGTFKTLAVKVAIDLPDLGLSWTCKAGALKATVDPGRQVAESDEANNTLTKVTSCLGFGT